MEYFSREVSSEVIRHCDADDDTSRRLVIYFH